MEQVSDLWRTLLSFRAMSHAVSTADESLSLSPAPIVQLLRIEFLCDSTKMSLRRLGLDVRVCDSEPIAKQ